MAQTYTVKKGDTRSGIAKSLGMTLEDIGLGRSQNPDLIYEGESLNVGKKEPAYVSEVKDQLGTGATGEKTDTTKDPYGIESLSAKATDYATKKDTAYNALKDLETTTYNSEYSSRNLGEKKARIATIDSDIAAARSERDAAIAKVRGNPGLSAAQMAGDVKKLADFQNSKINNLIQERNSVATEYNSALGEIDKAVSNKVKDKEREYGYYADLEKTTKDAISEYQKTLREELSSTQKQSNFEKQLAQALEIAQIRAADGGTTSYRLITDPVTGDPLYWIDPKTMQTFPVDEGTDQGTEDQPKAPAEAPKAEEQSWLRKLLPW